MFPDAADPLAALESFAQRLLRRHQEGLEQLVAELRVLKECQLRGPEEPFVLSRLILAAHQPSLSGQRRPLCFQPVLTCAQGAEIKVWEPTRLRDGTNGNLEWLGQVEDQVMLVPLTEVPTPIRIMLLPLFLCMVQDLLEEGALVRKPPSPV